MIVGAMALLTVAIANLVTALARIVNYPVNTAFEAAAFAGVWLGVLSAAYAEACRCHIDAGISLHRLLPWRTTKVIFTVLRLLMVACFLGLLMWTGLKQALSALDSGEVTLDISGWVIWPMEIAVPIGAAAWLVVLLTPQKKSDGGPHE